MINSKLRQSTDLWLLARPNIFLHHDSVFRASFGAPYGGTTDCCLLLQAAELRCCVFQLPLQKLNLIQCFQQVFLQVHSFLPNIDEGFSENHILSFEFFYLHIVVCVVGVVGVLAVGLRESKESQTVTEADVGPLPHFLFRT